MNFFYIIYNRGAIYYIVILLGFPKIKYNILLLKETSIQYIVILIPNNIIYYSNNIAIYLNIDNVMPQPLIISHSGLQPP